MAISFSRGCIATELKAAVDLSAEGVDYESCPAGWDDIGNGLCQHSSPEESK